MKSISVNTQQFTYPVYIGQGLIEDKKLWTNLCGTRKVAIITHPQIAKLYAEPIQDHLNARLITVESGEVHKSLTTLDKITQEMITAGLDRDSMVIALGGGVITDMGGFAAASFMRGIDYINVPTTLLAQCDAAIGGKTAVNHTLGKNLIGAFHQPQAVISDINTLLTLEPREITAGFAEVIKYGVIWDAAFVHWLEQNNTACCHLEPHALTQMITRCAEIKAEIVSQDETDQGIRSILNFGHTFGHALEHLGHYQDILHGEAVAIGMCFEAEVSARVNGLTTEKISRIRHLLQSMNCPVDMKIQHNLSDLLQSMHRDKKKLRNKLRMILLKDIGQAYIYDNVDENILKDVIRALRK